MNRDPRTINLRIHRVGALLLFLGAEGLVALLFRKHRSDLPNDVFSSFLVYGAWFLTLGPGIIGLEGMRLVNGTLLRSSATETAKQELTLRFLLGIGVAYGALGMIIIMLQRLVPVL